MATEAKQSVHSGNTVLVLISGKVVGLAQTLEGERSYGTTGLYGIGSIMPQEHVYQKYEGTLNVTRMRMKKENFATLGITALGEDILKRDVIEIVVLDKATKNVIISYRGCSAVNYSESFNANEVASERCQFTYLSASDTKSA